MSTLKELYEQAKRMRIDSGLYPLPDDEVCGFDVEIVPGFKLHVVKDWSAEDGLDLGLRIENERVNDIRISISGGHSKESVAGLLDVIAALRQTSEAGAA